MKEGMTSLDIYAWLKKNSYFIENSYIKKIFMDDERVILKIHKKDLGNRDLFLDPQGWIYFGEREENEISSKVKFLRDILENKRIDNVNQLNFDRILIFNLSGNMKIIFEMFGGGNFILTENEKIIFAIKYREWRTRKIKVGETYVPPPQTLNPLNLSENEFIENLKENREIVRILAIKFNLSHYSEYICSVSNIQKDKLGNYLSVDEFKRIYSETKKILDGIDGRGYICNNRLSVIKFTDCVEYENINDAILNIPKEEEKSEEERIREEQIKAIENFRRLAEEYRNIGDFIFSNLERINGIVEEIKKGINVENIVKRDGKNVTIKFQDFPYEIELDLTKKVSENGNYYYELSKKMKEKEKGALEAMSIKKEKKEKKEIKKERSRFWFEKYRWFFSSEGALVLAGRDARTNEEVVKKYLGERDFYVHADIHGAPSVVVKNTNITEKTLIEAGIFGLSYSKAWNAGLMAGDAYWVTYSQVSKMAESGEYVPKGAWVIRGKRNYMRNLPLMLAIGIIEYQGQKIMMCGPLDAVKAKTNDYIIIVPGNVEKSQIAEIVSKKFNYDKDEVMRILPPGNAEIRENV